MENTFFFDNKKGLNHFINNDWNDDVSIRIEKRLTQYVVITQED